MNIMKRYRSEVARIMALQEDVHPSFYQYAYFTQMSDIELTKIFNEQETKIKAEIVVLTSIKLEKQRELEVLKQKIIKSSDFELNKIALEREIQNLGNKIGIKKRQLKRVKNLENVRQDLIEQIPNYKDLKTKEKFSNDVELMLEHFYKDPKNIEILVIDILNYNNIKNKVKTVSELVTKWIKDENIAAYVYDEVLTRTTNYEFAENRIEMYEEKLKVILDPKLVNQIIHCQNNRSKPQLEHYQSLFEIANKLSSILKLPSLEFAIVSDYANKQKMNIINLLNDSDLIGSYQKILEVIEATFNQYFPTNYRYLLTTTNNVENIKYLRDSLETNLPLLKKRITMMKNFINRNLKRTQNSLKRKYSFFENYLSFFRKFEGQTESDIIDELVRLTIINENYKNKKRIMLEAYQKSLITTSEIINEAIKNNEINPYIKTLK